ncbi:hypothetical protein BGX28_000970 [Mortierella sp. GBA30]|nr:hypothetical protein BGX28_000970 [Mortierella sp. GBA30]
MKFTSVILALSAVVAMTHALVIPNEVTSNSLTKDTVDKALKGQSVEGSTQPVARRALNLPNVQDKVPGLSNNVPLTRRHVKTNVGKNVNIDKTNIDKTNIDKTNIDKKVPVGKRQLPDVGGVTDMAKNLASTSGTKAIKRDISAEDATAEAKEIANKAVEDAKGDVEKVLTLDVNAAVEGLIDAIVNAKADIAGIINVQVDAHINAALAAKIADILAVAADVKATVEAKIDALVKAHVEVLVDAIISGIEGDSKFADIVDEVKEERAKLIDAAKEALADAIAKAQAEADK